MRAVGVLLRTHGCLVESLEKRAPDVDLEPGPPLKDVSEVLGQAARRHDAQAQARAHVGRVSAAPHLREEGGDGPDDHLAGRAVELRASEGEVMGRREDRRRDGG